MNRQAVCVYVTMFAQLYFYICMFSVFINYFAFVLICVVVVVLYIRVFSIVNGVNWRNKIVTMFAFLQFFCYVQPWFTIESVFTRGFHH